MRGLRTLAACIALVAGAESLGAGPSAPLPPDFDDTVERMRRDWSLPGVAIAVVRAEGEPEIRTYGLRQWDRREPVTPDTMFGIASNTKQFIAAAIAVLAQDGKLAFDDPVIKHLPEFRVADPWVTREVTVRDLLSHRSGIASYNDWLEEVASVGEDELVAMLANYGQSSPFRSGVEYSSYTYVVLAMVIERLSGRPWGEYLRERLWQPLGMRHMAAHADEFAPSKNVLPTGDGWVEGVPHGLDALNPGVDVAAPHVQWENFYGGEAYYDRRELDNRTVHFHRTAIDAGQSVFASIADLATWAGMWVRGGDPRVLEPDTVREMLALNSLDLNEWPHRPDTPEIRHVGYGLGMAQFQRGDHIVYGHSGGELGYASLFIVDPRHGFAVIAMVNNLSHSWGACNALVQTMLDWQHGLPPTDWSARNIEQNKKEMAQNLANVAELWRKIPSDGAAPLTEAAIAGDYSSPIVGPLHIERRPDGLFATTGRAYDIELRHVRDNIWHGIAVSALRTSYFLTFEVDVKGQVDGLRFGWLADVGQPQHDFIYTRRNEVPEE